METENEPIEIGTEAPPALNHYIITLRDGSVVETWAETEDQALDEYVKHHSNFMDLWDIREG
jgi:hypothetical protein